MSFKETGRLTLYMFNKFYDYYKVNFDYELTLKKRGLTYERAYEKSMEEEMWF